MSIILGVPFSDKNLAECVDHIDSLISNGSNANHIITANPEVLLRLSASKETKSILESSALTVPDGIGIVIASKMLKQNIKERVAGVDLILSLLAKRNLLKKMTTVYLLGSTEENVKKAAEQLTSTYPYVKVTGSHHGYFDAADSSAIDAILNDINKHKPNLLLVGLGTPKQEQVIHSLKERIHANVCIGCGGVIDLLSGKKKRAPFVFRRLHLEWFYRLIKEPSRFKRQLNIPLFLLKVVD